MRELTAEDEKFLVEYCMKPENIWLALAIGQVRPKIREKIVSLFLKELDESVKKELTEKERDGQWQTCVSDPEIIVKEQGEPSIYMIKDRRGIEIHLCAYKGTDLFVATPAGKGAWPSGLEGFLERKDLGLKRDRNWRWWFDPAKDHKRIEPLSRLNDHKLRYEKILYFTDILVRFAEAISKELGN